MPISYVRSAAGVGNHTVDPHTSQQQCHGRKRHEKRVDDAIAEHRLRHDLFERAHIAERLVPTDAVNRRPNAFLQ
jgi:hypothetical protein